MIKPIIPTPCRVHQFQITLNGNTDPKTGLDKPCTFIIAGEGPICPEKAAAMVKWAANLELKLREGVAKPINREIEKMLDATLSQPFKKVLV